ncbi:MAG: pyridoxal phosphate-dependent aminotransferase [Deltaproteobacteria bacterium]|nr:pyridoxal phosphate-dependent aminotransferase [Deltaproteobacteria bacterium]
MKKILSQRAGQLKPSATLAIAAKERELKSQGVDVIGFGAGEPDFPTPERIREAAKRSLDRGETFYTPVGGTVELKKAVAHRFLEDYGLEYKPENIVVSCGAKHSLYNIFQAIIDPGDEIICLAPYWVSYPEMVALAGGKPVIVETSEKKLFEPEIEAVAKRVSAETKAIVLNYPSNPTGVMYSTEFLEQLARLVEANDLMVISDEIYDKLLFDGRKYTPFATVPGMKSRTVTVNGVSKTYAMTGLRIGYLATDNVEIVKATTNIQSQSTSNPCNTAQAAAVEALSGPQSEVVEMRGVFERRRDMMTELVNQVPGLSMIKPHGAFYAFVNISEFIGKKGVSGSSDLAGYLLEKHHVACVPGGPFGSDDHIRLSFATKKDIIAEGMKRIRSACAELSNG